MTAAPKHKEIATVEELPAPEPRVKWRGAQEIFAPLPPTRWVVPGLHVGPGRPSMFAGYGASAKTLAAQSAGLSLAAGVSVWGQFPCSRMKVKHLDHEQGWLATAKRYQRLLLGLHLDPPDVDGHLFVANFPDVYLTDPRAVDEYCRACEGADLVILDALRGAAVGVDENDSRIRACVDNLTRVSERIGTAFWVIHHAGKPKDGHADMRTVLRGSSAIFDACGAVFVMSGTKGQPKLVSQQKTPADAEGAAIEDFHLAIEDVLVDTNPTGGVRVAYGAVPVKEALTPDSSYEEHAARVLAFIEANPACSKRSIRARAGLRATRADEVLALLIEDSRVTWRKGPSGWPVHDLASSEGRKDDHAT